MGSVGFDGVPLEPGVAAGMGDDDAGSMDRSSKLSRSSCGFPLAAGPAACMQAIPMKLCILLHHYVSLNKARAFLRFPASLDQLPYGSCSRGFKGNVPLEGIVSNPA